ncbi:MAG: hypothetical protein QOF76_5455 [Solirubrobacteraceae bacterium]|jgi:cyclohexanone monooxygenase|nr:hypothetical protein [Solirubrobacteraceae bacterium]
MSDVIIVGAGFSGIGAAIKLSEIGMDDFLVVEEGEDVGGTWHWNRYPGIAVDIPSFSYQYSFERRPDWSRVYANGGELRRYAHDVVEKHELRPKIRFNTQITGAAFDEASHVWRLQTATGEELESRYVIVATGVLTKPKKPEIPGVDDFAGTTLHTARWDHSVDLRGKRVAVIGTGASAVQLIPTLAPDVGHMTVFQRTPIWCLPKIDPEMPGPVQKILEHVPGGQQVLGALSQTFVEFTFPLALHYPQFVPTSWLGEKIGRKHLADQVKDPETRAKLTPQYSLGCKRPGFHNTYLKTFNRENVALETTPIERFTATGVVTTDGTEHPIDVLVLATGFKVFEAGNIPAFDTRGVGGKELGAYWRENRFQSYQGVSVPDFPNLFTIFGPYAYNGASYFTLIENQMRHITRCLKAARARGATAVEVTRAAHDRYFQSMLGRRHRQILTRGNCASANSYYFDDRGDSPFRASPTLEARWRSSRFALDDYRFSSVPVEREVHVVLGGAGPGAAPTPAG